MSSSVQVINDRMPSTASGPDAPWLLAAVHGLAQRIERAGADVAIDDADRSKRQGPELLVGVPILGAVGGGCLCHWRRLLGSATLLG